MWRVVSVTNSSHSSVNSWKKEQESLRVNAGRKLLDPHIFPNVPWDLDRPSGANMLPEAHIEGRSSGVALRIVAEGACISVVNIKVTHKPIKLLCTGHRFLLAPIARSLTRPLGSSFPGSA